MLKQTPSSYLLLRRVQAVIVFLTPPKINHQSEGRLLPPLVPEM